METLQQWKEKHRQERVESNEVFKTIPGYEGIYEISSLGRVRSLPRLVKCKNEKFRLTIDKILRQRINKKGYFSILLNKNNISKMYLTHQLVGISFLNHTLENSKIVINHKNFIRSDNRLENLETISQRENANKKHLKSISKYVGVHLDKKSNKWHSKILIDKNRVYLGSFDNEIDAHLAYENKLNTL